MKTNYGNLLGRIQESMTRCRDKSCLLGFDGTVDVICKPVEKRDWAPCSFHRIMAQRDSSK